MRVFFWVILFWINLLDSLKHSPTLRNIPVKTDYFQRFFDSFVTSLTMVVIRRPLLTWIFLWFFQLCLNLILSIVLRLLKSFHRNLLIGVIFLHFFICEMSKQTLLVLCLICHFSMTKCLDTAITIIVQFFIYFRLEWKFLKIFWI